MRLKAIVDQREGTRYAICYCGRISAASRESRQSFMAQSHTSTDPNGDRNEKDKHCKALDIQSFDAFERYGVARLTTNPEADPLLPPR